MQKLIVRQDYLKKITPRKLLRLALIAHRAVERANEKVRRLYWVTTLLWKQDFDSRRKSK